jgi:probable F420-dependent oxidoreductase
MQFYVQVSHMETAAILALARAVEDAGLAGLSLADHLVSPDPLPSVYPYSPDGSPPFTRETPWPDAWVLIGALSAVTTRVQFLTNVFILPLRHPIIVARAVGTAAVLTGGRVALGVGVGWLEEEFTAVAADFAHRGKVTDESIAALRMLWTGETTEFHGSYIDFGRVVMRPPPPQPVPILVGGKSPAALRRAATIADGYLGTRSTIAELAETIRVLRELRSDSPLAHRPFTIHARATGAATVDDYRRLADTGVDAYTIALPVGCTSTVADLRGELERFADEVAAPLGGRCADQRARPPELNTERNGTA